MNKGIEYSRLKNLIEKVKLSLANRKRIKGGINRDKKTTGRVKVLIILIIISFVFTSLYIYDKVSTFQTIAYRNTILNEYGNESNYVICLIGIDEKIKGYEFVKNINLLNFSNNRINIYAVNPLFSTTNTENTNLRNFWEDIAPENRVKVFLDEVENLTGIKIDNYIIYNTSDVNVINSNFDFTIQATQKYSVAGTLINKGDQLRLSKYYSIINSLSEPNEESIKFSNDFTIGFINFLSEKMNILSLINDSNGFRKSFKSGISSNNYLQFLWKFGDYNVLNQDSNYMMIEYGTPSKITPNVFIANIANLDVNLNLNFRTFDVIKEQRLIEILNGSQFTGVASKLQRMFSLRGGNVIKIGNYPDFQETSVIYLDIKNINNYTNTLNLITDILPSSVKIKDISEYKFNFSGDLVVVLGKDFRLSRQ